MDETPWTPVRQCTATNRFGLRCRRNSIPGGEVCVLHGGAAPQTREAARRKLLAGADLAIDHLLSTLEPRPPCPACGRSDADRDPVVLRACQLVLDRSGFHPTLTVQHEAAAEPPAWIRWLTGAELEQVRVLIDRAQERMAAGEPVATTLLFEGGIEDGVLVPEEEPEAEATRVNPLGGFTSEGDK